MNFEEALECMRHGASVTRPTLRGLSFKMQEAVVPIWIEQKNSNCSQWHMCKFPVVASVPSMGLNAVRAIGAPYAFSAEERAATDWEVTQS